MLFHGVGPHSPEKRQRYCTSLLLILIRAASSLLKNIDMLLNKFYPEHDDEFIVEFPEWNSLLSDHRSM